MIDCHWKRDRNANKSICCHTAYAVMGSWEKEVKNKAYKGWFGPFRGRSIGREVWNSLKSFESGRWKLSKSVQLQESQCLWQAMGHFWSADCEGTLWFHHYSRKNASPEPGNMELCPHCPELRLSRVYHLIQRGTLINHYSIWSWLHTASVLKRPLA